MRRQIFLSLSAAVLVCTAGATAFAQDTDKSIQGFGGVTFGSSSIIGTSAAPTFVGRDTAGLTPNIEVIGEAPNGKVALQKIAQLTPDLVTLDVEMPEMNGLQTLKAIRKTHPRLPVIMFSAVTERGAADTLEALHFGASDYVTKPAGMARLNRNCSSASWC